VSDMRAVIQPKSDQLNTDSLLGAPITITITNVAIRPGTEQPISIEYEGDAGKPYKPCKSMARVMVHCWGDDAKVYIGHSMRLYADPKVRWGGLEVGGIRISHMSHIDRAMTLALTESKAKRQLFTVLPLVAEEKPGGRKPPTPKEIADGLVMRFNRTPDIDAHNELLSDEIVSKQVAWLKDKQPVLHGLVDAAIQASVARHTGSPADDGGTLDL
jgi:hypothetical protein